MAGLERCPALLVSLALALLGRRSAHTLLAKADRLDGVAFLGDNHMAFRRMVWCALRLVIASHTHFFQPTIFHFFLAILAGFAVFADATNAALVGAPLVPGLRIFSPEPALMRAFFSAMFL